MRRLLAVVGLVGALISVTVPVAFAQGTDVPQVTYSTRNGPRTAAQLRTELAAAGYTGPWDVASMRGAYDRATRPFKWRVVEFPGSEGEFWCLQSNPSCGRDDWWIEWNETQSEQFVQYKFVGPGLVTEERFIEVIWLLWQWPEGKSLLKSASDAGVTVIAGPDNGGFASYVPRLNKVRVNRDFTETSTWMVADVVAHELKHAADQAAGMFMSDSFSDCIVREQRAYGVEQRFLRWVSIRFGGLPSGDDIAYRLSSADLNLFENLFSLATSPDVAAQAFKDYRSHC